MSRWRLLGAVLAVVTGTAAGIVLDQLVPPRSAEEIGSGAALLRLEVPIDMSCNPRGCRLCFEEQHGPALQAMLCPGPERVTLTAFASSVTTAALLLLTWQLTRERSPAG